MESRRTEANRDVIDQRREVIPPAAPQERPARAVGVYETEPEGVPPVGPRVRWGGVMSGVVLALGIVLLLTALGLAIGITAVGDPRAATTGTATGLGIGAGFWAALTLLVAYFLGGLVSTMVTDRPDRGAAFVHGALVWTLASGFLIWLLGQGISLGASGLLGALSGLTHTATTAVGDRGGRGRPGAAAGAHRLHADHRPAGRSADRLPVRLRHRHAPHGGPDGPRPVPHQGGSRARQSGPGGSRGTQLPRPVQGARATAGAEGGGSGARGATVGSWVTFIVLALTLGVSILGALAGIPSLRTWRTRWTHAGRA